ncbi:MAG: ATP-binding cassette domain-containing protein, partial [Planctomycetota bacterium]
MPESSEKIIQVKNLTGGYGDTVILKDITFDVYQGEVFIILGGSGCGKSTMLKFMIGLGKPFRGQVFVDGVDVVTANEQQYQQVLRSFGVMYQNGAL